MAGSIIKSVQSGSIVIPAGSTQANINLGSAVVFANAVVFLNGFTSPNSSSFDAALSFPCVVLLSTTEVIAATGVADPTYARTVYYTVVEFVSGVIKTNQTNFTICNASNNTQTSTLTTSVNLSNAFIINQGNNYAPSGSSWGNIGNGTQPIVQLTGVNQVTAKSGFLTGSDTNTMYWTVLEFNAGFINSIQTGSIGITDPALSNTATITSVVPGNSITLFMGWYIDTYAIGIPSKWMPILQLTNATTVTATILANPGFSPAETTHVYYAVIEFVASIVRSKQSGTTAINASSSSATASLTAVNVPSALINYLGFTDSSSSDNGNNTSCFPAAILTNSTTGTFDVGGAVGNGAITVSWEVIEFLYNIAISTDATIRLEDIATQRLDPQARLESLATDKGDAMLRLESKATQQRDTVAPDEYLSRVLLDTNARDEGIGTIKADSMELEWLASMRTDRVAPTDSLAGTTTDRLGLTEALQTITQDNLAVFEAIPTFQIANNANMQEEFAGTYPSDTRIMQENRTTIFGDTKVRDEWIIGTTTISPAQGEWLAGQRINPNIYGELTVNLSADQKAYIESLPRAALNSQAQQEALFTAAGIPLAQLDSGSKALANASSFLENIGTLSINQILPVEVVTSSMRSNSLAPVDFLSSLKNNIAGVIEALASPANNTGVRAEWLGTDTADSPLRAEVKGTQARDTGIVLEWLSNALNNFTNNNLPLEIVVSVKKDAGLPLDALPSVHGNMPGTVEWLKGLPQDSMLNIEWSLKFLPPPTPGRTFNVQVKITLFNADAPRDFNVPIVIP